MKKGVKAGRLANGFELGKGKIVHYLENSYVAICGSQAAITFSETPEKEVSCKKCVKIHERNNLMKNALNKIDKMVT